MIAQIIKDESWEDYTKSGSIGSSALSAWGMVGFEAWSSEYLEKPYSEDDTSTPGGAREGGDYLDALLTGNKPLESFAVRPEGLTGRTKDGKAWAEENAGKTLLTAEQAAEVAAALPCARKAIAALELSDCAEFQVTLRGEIAGLSVQNRPDIWIEHEDEIDVVDLKYISQFGKFNRDFFGSRYEIQAALTYRLAALAGVTKRVNVWFLTIESGTLMPRSALRRVPPYHLDDYADRLERRCAEIVRVRESERGFVDSLIVEDIVLTAWQERELRGPIEI